MADKVFISGDAIPSDTIVEGEEIENNCIRQDLSTQEVLRQTVPESKNEVEEDIYP
jgi:hypothetical protein